MRLGGHYTAGRGRFTDTYRADRLVASTGGFQAVGMWSEGEGGKGLSALVCTLRGTVHLPLPCPVPANLSMSIAFELGRRFLLELCVHTRLTAEYGVCRFPSAT